RFSRDWSSDVCSSDLDSGGEPREIVVFDGICSFCSGAVQFILKYDVDGRLAFAPMQSRAGRELLEAHGFDPADVQTFLFVRGSRSEERRVGKECRWTG